MTVCKDLAFARIWCKCQIAREIIFDPITVYRRSCDRFKYVPYAF